MPAEAATFLSQLGEQSLWELCLQRPALFQTDQCSNKFRKLERVCNVGSLSLSLSLSLSFSLSATSSEEKAMSWLRDKDGETAVNAGAKGSQKRLLRMLSAAGWSGPRALLLII